MHQHRTNSVLSEYVQPRSRCTSQSPHSPESDQQQEVQFKLVLKALNDKVMAAEEQLKEIEREVTMAWGGVDDLVRPCQILEVALTDVLVELSSLPICNDTSTLETTVKGLAKRLATVQRSIMN